MNSWRNNFKNFVGWSAKLLLNGTKSHSEVADSVLCKTFSKYLRYSTTLNRSECRRYRINLRINVISEADVCRLKLVPIESDWQVVPGVSSVVNDKAVSRVERRWVALYDVLFKDCSIHKIGVVKDALNFAEAHIDEVLSYHSDLSVASSRSTNRSDTEYFRSIIVKILYGIWRVFFSLIWNA